jgi:hypothetical protein
MGLAILTRSVVWAALPLVGYVLIRRVPQHLRLRCALTFLAPVLALTILIPIRNAIASGSPVLTPTEATVVFKVGNVPASRSINSQPWLSLSQRVNPDLVAVAEFVISEPGAFLQNMARRAAFVVGLPSASGNARELVHWPVLSLWLFFPVALISKPRSPVIPICLILIATYASILILAFADASYYYRLVMPITVPLAVMDALALRQLYLRFAPRPPGSTPGVTLAAQTT